MGKLRFSALTNPLCGYMALTPFPADLSRPPSEVIWVGIWTPFLIRERRVPLTLRLGLLLLRRGAHMHQPHYYSSYEYPSY
jgi:hypothetical protein